MNPLPLQGIRVADFGQVIAAPVTAQMLGWLGAEVVLIETESRFTTRVWPPFGDGEFGINNSGGFNLVNNNKLSCSLDLSKPEALKVARQLIAVSDVLVENYATGAMERLGLGYEEVREMRPDIVYMSLGAFGRSGPFKDLTGFHSVINLFSGLGSGHRLPRNPLQDYGRADSRCLFRLLRRPGRPAGAVPPFPDRGGPVHRGLHDRGAHRDDPRGGDGILAHRSGAGKDGQSERAACTARCVPLPGR